MRYFFRDIQAPDGEDLTWTFRDDLRNVFGMDSNNDIELLLKRRDVIDTDDESDCESACTWIYFKTEAAARAFLKRLNAQSEVKAYHKPTNELCYVLTRKDWRKLCMFLQKNMSKKKRDELTALGITIIDYQKHWVAAK